MGPRPDFHRARYGLLQVRSRRRWMTAVGSIRTPASAVRAVSEKAARARRTRVAVDRPENVHSAPCLGSSMHNQFYIWFATDQQSPVGRSNHTRRPLLFRWAELSRLRAWRL